MPENANPTPPANAGQPTNPTPPAGGEGDKGQANTTPESLELARKNGELEAENKRLKGEYEGYRQKVDPVLETLYSDNELLQKATEIHNKRIGRATTTPPKETPPNNAPNQPAQPTIDPDNRNATINIISGQFEDKVGMTKLPQDKQVQLRGAVGQMLKEMLDPKGNKTIGQVFEEVSLTKLPWYLQKAYDLVTKDDQLASAKEQGKSEILSQYQGDTGVIGSMPGGSVPLDQVTLTPKERETASKMGISEEDYLKGKKEILSSRA